MNDEALDLRAFLAVFGRRKWVILSVVATFVALAAAWSLSRTPRYEASASVLVDLRMITGQQFGGGPSAAAAASEQALRTEVEVLRGDAVEAAAEEALGGEEVDVRAAPAAGEVVVVTAGAGSARQAAAGANAYAEAYLAVRGRELATGSRELVTALRERLAEIDEELAGVEGELVQLDPGDPTAPARQAQLGAQLSALNVERTSLTGQVATLRGQARSLRAGVGQITAAASEPGSPTSPDLVRDLLLGLAAGLLAGAATAVALHLLDDRVRTRRQLAGVLGGVPVLAALPRHPRRVAGDEVVAAHRGLRAAVDHARTTSAFAVLVVTAPRRGSGATTVTANLALAGAQAGSRVTVVDADLRDGDLGRVLAIDAEPGFTDVSGDAELAAALRSAPAAPELRVLGTGREVGDHGRLLAAPRVLPMLRALQREADLVLVDTPPVLESSDAEALAGLGDGVLLVVAAGTRVADVEEAVAALRAAGGRLVGAVLNRADGTRSLATRPREWAGADPQPQPTPDDVTAAV